MSKRSNGLTSSRDVEQGQHVRVRRERTVNDPSRADDHGPGVVYSTRAEFSHRPRSASTTYVMLALLQALPSLMTTELSLNLRRGNVRIGIVDRIFILKCGMR